MTFLIILILFIGAVVLMRQHARIEELENWLNDHDKAFLYGTGADDKGLDFYLHKAEPKKPKAKKGK